MTTLPTSMLIHGKKKKMITMTPNTILIFGRYSMIMEYLPKINIVLGVIVIIFFFFPWISIDVGNVVIMKCSGYDLAAGNISVNDNALQQESGQPGTVAQAQPSTQSDRNVRPQLYLFIIIVCALGI